MSKELEALKRIETTFSMNKQGKESVYRGYTNSLYPYYEDFDLVLNALKRLEAIDNSNPSEALECLERIYANIDTNADYYFVEASEDYNTIKQALLKQVEIDDEKLIEALNLIRKSHWTALQLLGVEPPDKDVIKAIEYVEQALTTKSKKELAFDLIKEKDVNIASLKVYDLEEYNMIYENNLTQEEFNLLKEMVE